MQRLNNSGEEYGETSVKHAYKYYGENFARGIRDRQTDSRAPFMARTSNAEDATKLAKQRDWRETFGK